MSPQTMTQSYEVAIVGLGPVGATLANILGAYGIRTVVLDRYGAVYPLPRAVAIDDEAMRIFQGIGLAGAVSDIVAIGAGAHFVDAEGKLLLEWLRPQQITANGWYMNNRFHQPDLEAVLRAGIARLPTVTVLQRREVSGFAEDAEGVSIDAVDLDSGRAERIRASYVVGCDGARSLTRTAIGGGMEDLGFDEPWLVADLAIDADGLDFGPFSIHYCDPVRPASSIFIGGRRRRWEFRLQPGDDPLSIAEPESVWPLLARWITPSQARLERAVVYTFRSRIADRWRLGRLLIAGDAAHLTPPFMAQGLCAGLRDCANLGWKLHRVISGRADPDLLDTYQSERHPHVRAFIALTVEMGRLINSTASGLTSGAVSQRADGPQQLSQLLPSLGPGLAAGQTQHAGLLFPQPRLSTGELLDDRIGRRPALLIAAGQGTTAATLLARHNRTDEIALVDDTAPGIQSWLREHGAAAVMLRPDRYVLGTAAVSDDLASLVLAA